MQKFILVVMALVFSAPAFAVEMSGAQAIQKIGWDIPDVLEGTLAENDRGCVIATTLENGRRMVTISSDITAQVLASVTVMPNSQVEAVGVPSEYQDVYTTRYTIRNGREAAVLSITTYDDVSDLDVAITLLGQTTTCQFRE